jgi:hypothetical protein
MNTKDDLLEGIWAGISVLMGETTAAFTIGHALHNTPSLPRFALVACFGLLLAVTLFLMGLPLIHGVKQLFKSVSDGIRKLSTKRTKKS